MLRGMMESRERRSLAPRSRVPLVLPEGVALEDISRAYAASSGGSGRCSERCMSDGDKTETNADGEDTKRRVCIFYRLYSTPTKNILFFCVRPFRPK